MADFHISVSEAARDFLGLMAKVRSGVEVIIEDGAQEIAVMHAPAQPARSAAECIALLPQKSGAVIDEEFPGDVAAAVAAHREALNPPAWD